MLAFRLIDFRVHIFISFISLTRLTPIGFDIFLKYTTRVSRYDNVAGERNWIQQRYILSLMGFMALAMGYIQRFCISLAITEMAEQVRHTPLHINSEVMCPIEETIGNATLSKKVPYI